MSLGIARLRSERWQALTCPRHVIHYLPFDSRLYTLKQKTDGRLPICFCLGQATGIEPARSAWEAEVLPLNYACV